MKQQDQIAALLEKYWEGETSLEEERILKAYFNGGRVDPRFEAEAVLFRVLKEEQSVEWHRPPAVKPVQRFRFHWAAAAAILLLLAGGTVWWQSQSPVQPVAPPVAQHRPSLPVDKTERPAVENSGVRKNQETQAPALIAAVKKRKFRMKPAKTPASLPSEDAEAEAAMAEIKAALALVSRKLKRGKEEAGRGLQEMEHIEIFRTKKSDG